MQPKKGHYLIACIILIPDIVEALTILVLKRRESKLAKP
jgi:hypothetical protein